MKQRYITSVYPVFTSLMILLIFYPLRTEAQLERERAVPNAPVDNIFWAGSNIGLGTVHNIQGGNLNSTVLHTFGLVEGGLDRFWGLDDGANTRLGIDLGITDRLSVGIGRMTFRNVVDLKGKYNILRQTRSGSIPLELAVNVSTGIVTMDGLGWETTDRFSYFGSLMVARKFNRLSLQISPMVAHFNRTWSPDNQMQLFGLGILANVDLNDRFSLSGEYIPVLGDRNPGTADAMGFALNIDTGGHVFQIFLTSSQWHNEAYILANNSHKFWEGEFRFGFNINRVFGL